MDWKTVRNTFVTYALILFAVLQLINYFFHCIPLNYVSAILLIAIIVLVLPTMKKTARLVLLMLTAAGSTLLIISGADLSTWLAAVLKNGNLLLLLICVPMISAPFYYEDYQLELKHLAQVKMRNMMSFLVLCAICTHFLGVILSIGSIIIIYELLSPFGKLYKADGPFLKTVQRAYCSSGFWSPAWASVIVYSAFPNVKWGTMIPVGLALAALFNLLNLGSIYLETKRHPGRYPDIEPDVGVTFDKKKLLTMFLLFVLMIASILVVNGVTKWDLMLAVTVVALLFPLVIALMQKKMPAYKVQMKKFYNVQLVKVRSQIAVFTIAGFLGKALSEAGIGELLARLLPDWMIAYPALMVGCIMILLVLPTFVGVHPAAAGTALVAAITPAAIGLTNYTFSLAILMGWLLATMMGPFSAVGLLLSANTGKNNYAITIGNNWKFCILCIVLFSLIISVIGPILG